MADEQKINLEEKIKQAAANAAKRDGKTGENGGSSDNSNSSGAHATDGDNGGNGSTQDPQQTKIAELEAELANMTEMAKRSMADLQNVRRRQEEERAQLIIGANARLMKDLLPAIDSLARAKEHVPAGAEEWFKGLEMSINQITKACINHGLTPIEAAGQPFDPELHEALLQGPGEQDMVVEELEKGYKIGNVVVRHSKVKVGDGS